MVVLAVVAANIFNLAEHGVSLVGAIASGLPNFGVPDVAARDFLDLAPAAAGIVLLSFAEGVSAAKTYAAADHYEIDANRELIGAGAANLASGLSSVMVVGGSLSKTAVNGSAGAKVSFLLLLYRSSHPNVARLGRMRGTDRWVDRERNPDVEETPGVVVLRAEGELFFANAETVGAAVRKAAAIENIAGVVIDGETISRIDVTGAEMLSKLAGDLARDRVRVTLAAAVGQVRDVLERTEIGEGLELSRLASVSVSQAPVRDQADGAGCITVKEAPWGSIRPAKRPIGMSMGSAVTLAPSSRALATVPSQSATAKHTPQCGGTSAPKKSSVICIMPPTGFPASSQTV